MSFSITDNYSVLNNYSYKNKTFLLSTLDLLSTPCRRVLGGRNVSVLSQTYENEMSTAAKTATLFFSVLIFPVAVISISSLLIKMATFPWFWEKKKVVIQSQETWKVINQFDQAVKSKEYDKALQFFGQRPDLIERSDVYNNLFKAINWKINENCPGRTLCVASLFSDQ